MFRLHGWRLLAIAAGILGVACACAGSSLADADSVGAPVLDSVVPATADLRGGAVVDLKLFGSGFDAQATSILIDDVVVSSRPAADRRSLTFAMPTTLRISGEASPTRISSGIHQLRIQTSAGASNILSLTVLNP